MTQREIIMARLNHEGTAITPYTISFEPGLSRRLAEYYGDENWREKKLRSYTRAFLHADTSMTARIDEKTTRDVFGSVWRTDKNIDHLEKSALPEPSFAGYTFPSADLFLEKLLAGKAEAMKKYREDTDHFRIISIGWGVFENTWRIRGFENAMMDTLAEPDFYAELANRLTDIFLAIIAACADIPAEAYQFGDDWGDQRGTIISPQLWRKFMKPCWKKIYAEVHRQGKLVVQHCCGSIVDIYDDLIEIGMDCHESVQPEARGMAPELLKARWGKKLSFWGCLGSQSTLNFGTPAEIRAEILRLHNLFKDDGGYVLAPAKSLMDNMDTMAAVAAVETLAELNEKQ